MHLLEASDRLDERPRAAIYNSAALPDLKKAGVLDEVRRRGFAIDTMAFRRFEDHSVITSMDGRAVADVDGEDLRSACLVLDELDGLMLDDFLTKYNGTISWNHRVTRVGQDEKTAWVDVETPEGPTRVHGDYVVGCDGATSQVRKSLFDEYPGFTWDRQIVATNVGKLRFPRLPRVRLKRAQG